MFEPFHPEYPPCTYEPPPFLRTRPIRIKDRPKDKPIPPGLGPGAYSPVLEERPRIKVYRKDEPPREVWPHLKRDAQLPDPGNYWEYRPFFTPPRFVSTAHSPRTYVLS
jgi:hypothetical protein